MSASLAALAAVGLTACRTNVGTAAVVGGSSISENSITSYLNPQGPSAKVLDRAAAQGTTIQPRVDVLSELIKTKLFEDGLAASGGVPNDAALADLHDEAIQRLVQGATGGAQFDQQLRANLGTVGYDPSYAALLVHNLELEDAVINRTKAANPADLVRKVKAFGVSITVNPRFGTWDWSQLGLSQSTTAGVPDFVKAVATTGTATG